MYYLLIALGITILVITLYKGSDSDWGSNELSIRFGKFFVAFATICGVGVLIVFGLMDIFK